VNRLNPASHYGLGFFTLLPGSVSRGVIVDVSQGRAWVREVKVRRVVVRDLMRYMVHPLDIVQVEMCEHACCAESCFLDDFVRAVCAEGEEGGETVGGGCVTCACAAHDYGESIDVDPSPVLANGIGEGVYLWRIS
jgi:hypothetical protein